MTQLDEKVKRLEKLRKDISRKHKSLLKDVSDRDAEIAVKVAELAAKQKEVDDLKANGNNGADQRVVVSTTNSLNAIELRLDALLASLAAYT